MRASFFSFKSLNHLKFLHTDPHGILRLGRKYHREPPENKGKRTCSLRRCNLLKKKKKGEKKKRTQKEERKRIVHAYTSGRVPLLAARLTDHHQRRAARFRKTSVFEVTRHQTRGRTVYASSRDGFLFRERTRACTYRVSWRSIPRYTRQNGVYVMTRVATKDLYLPSRHLKFVSREILESRF